MQQVCFLTNLHNNLFKSETHRKIGKNMLKT